MYSTNQNSINADCRQYSKARIRRAQNKVPQMLIILILKWKYITIKINKITIKGRNNFSAILIFKKDFNLDWRKSQFLIDSGVSTKCLIDSGWCLCGKQILSNRVNCEKQILPSMGFEPTTSCIRGKHLPAKSQGSHGRERTIPRIIIYKTPWKYFSTKAVV